MFAANTEFNVGSCFASQVARDFHQAADPPLVDRRERIRVNNIELRISRQKTSGIVPAHPERRLRKVVCAETEELGVTRDLVGQECRARDLDHCPNEITKFCFLFLCHFTGDAADDVDLKF